MWNWWKVYGGRNQLHLLAIRNRGELVGLAPLLRAPERRPGEENGWVLRFLGNGETGCDYLDVICDATHQREVLATIARVLIEASEEWNVVELSALPADSMTRRYLGDFLRRRNYLVGRARNTVCPYLDLPSSWDVFLHRIDKGLRSILRYKTNQLLHRHRVRFERCCRESQFDTFFATLVRLHQHLWQGRGISGAFGSESYHRFHRNFAEAAMERDWLRLFLLRIDDEPVGAVCGYHFGEVGYFFQMGHDSGSATQPLDVILIGRAIRDAIDSGLTQFRFMRSDSEYTLRWTKHSHMNTHWEVRPAASMRLGGMALASERASRTYNRAV
jgi:CelD/BcsL family acetyltransferase involved in cellulose biosynthesis